MLKKIICLLVFTITFFSCKQNNELNTKEYFDVINEQLTGDLAYETTAFVEKYWRVAGNTGFNKSIYKIAEQLEKGGYILEENATASDLLTYRIETRPLKRPTWEPVDATVIMNDEEKPLLNHSTNRNMIALNSYSTSPDGVTAEVIYIDDIKKLAETNVEGKIVFAETHPSRIFKTAVTEGGALGYNNVQ